MGTEIAPVSGIHSLPVELIAEITKYTEDSGLCNLRLTCRALYQSRVSHFARTILHTLKTDISPKSLARTEEIANNQLFGPCVRKLKIVRHSECYLGPCFLNTTSNETYIQSWCDVINRLENCRSFVLRYSAHTTPHLVSIGITLDEVTGLVIEALSTEHMPMESFSVNIFNNRARRPDESTTQFGLANFGMPAVSQLKELSFVMPDAETETINWTAKAIQGAKSLRKLRIKFSWNCKSTSLLS